jgi:PAS domain S-box-containing protein
VKPPQTSVEFFENLVEFAPDALLVVNSAGTIIFANGTADVLFGFSKGELRGQPIERLVPEQLRRQHTGHRARYTDNPHLREMGAAVNELLGMRRDGSEFPVEIRLSPIAIGDERMFAAAVRDVTDRRRAAQLLRIAQQEADHANATKSRFLATASHDLRQPLQALLLLNAALLQQVLEPNAREMLARGGDALDSMARLLNVLLDISKLEAGSIRPDIEDVSVAELFEALRQEFDSLAGLRGLTLSVSPTPHYVKTDRTLFRQLLENLIANAIKFTETGGIKLGCLSGTDGLVITVADTGIGIAPDKIGAIFDDFYQVDRAYGQGIGLGLAIVRRIASLLGLSVDVSSEPGKGTRFQVGVPAAMVANLLPTPPAEVASARSLTPVSGAVILLIEDDDAVRSATEFYLRAFGHVAIAAASIDDAERALESASRTPDLILSDYHLGSGQTGLDAINRLRSRAGRTLPALLLSGDTSTATRELAQVQACRILSKPVNIDELNEALSSLLAQA